MAEVDQRPLQNGEEIEGFRIQDVLGSGSFGITYLALNINLERQVAIKEYFPQNAWRIKESRVIRTNDGEATDSYKIGLDRFYKEGQILAQFKHPNIVGVQHILSANNTAYIVMDYEDGETLDSYMNRLGRPLTYKEAKIIFNPLLDGLRAIHDRGLLHLDIKPANIFLRRDDSPVLIDFGGARHQLGQASRLVSFLVATDGFAPNEQYAGSALNLKPVTDIYAMGATLYYCLTNQIPAEAQIRATAIIDNLSDPFISPSMLLDQNAYPNHFLPAIEASLNMKASSRPQSVREFQQRLFESISPSPPPPPPPPPSNTNNSWTTVFLTIALILSLIFAGFFWKKSESQQFVNSGNQSYSSSSGGLKNEEPVKPTSLESRETQFEQQSENTCVDGRLESPKIRQLVEGRTAIGKKIVDGLKISYNWKEYQEMGGISYFRKTTSANISKGQWKIVNNKICWCYGTCTDWSCKYIESHNNCSTWYYIDSETYNKTGEIYRWVSGNKTNY